MNRTLFPPSLSLLGMMLFLQQSTHALYMHRIPSTNYAQAPAMFEDEPVIVTESLSYPKECQRWRDHILTRSRSERVRVRQERQTTTQFTLGQAFQSATTNSTHWNPLYITSIGSSCSTDQLPLQDLLEELLDTNPYDDTTDWFSFLGRHANVHDTLIVAGEGSTSATIRSHPFTKLFLCLEGSQLMRAVPPHRFPNWKQQAKPLWGKAWEEFPLSMGSQLPPDLNLFAFRHREVDEQEPYDVYEQYAEDPILLHPSFAIPNLEDCDRTQHDLWQSSVLLPGDLAVIPPGWWYQTYNLEDSPCMGVYSQRCGGSTMGAGMVQHMLESAFGNQNSRLQLVQKDADYYYSKEEAQELVDKLFDVLEEHYDDEDADSDKAKPKKASQEER